MIDTEKLAIECGAQVSYADITAYVTNEVGCYKLTPKQLNTFAKAYLNEWLKEKKVEVINGKYLAANEDGTYLYTFYSERNLNENERFYIALPSEVK